MRRTINHLCTAAQSENKRSGVEEEEEKRVSGSPDHYPRFADYEWQNGFGSLS